MRLSTSTRIAPMLIQTEFFGLGRRFSSSVPPFWRYRAGPSPAGEDFLRYATSADFRFADLRGGLAGGDSPHASGRCFVAGLTSTHIEGGPVRVI